MLLNLHSRKNSNYKALFILGVRDHRQNRGVPELQQIVSKPVTSNGTLNVAPPSPKRSSCTTFGWQASSDSICMIYQATIMAKSHLDAIGKDGHPTICHDWGSWAKLWWFYPRSGMPKCKWSLNIIFLGVFLALKVLFSLTKRFHVCLQMLG